MGYPVFQVPAGDVLPIFFDSFSGSTGASVTMSGFAVTDIEVYKDGSATQRASDAGYALLDTDGIDFDGITGIHGFSIDTGDNTDAGFYTVGAWFHVVVSAITVDGQTVSFVAAAFRLMAAEGVAGVPDVNVTHVSDTAQTAGDIIGDTNDIQSRLPAALVSGRMDASVGAMAANTLTASALASDAVTEIQSGLATSSALATVDGKVDVIDATADAILVDTAEIGVAGAGLTALASAANLATVAGYLDTEIAAIKARTDLLPNAAAGASGGLVINGANTGAVTFDSGVTISNAGGSALTLSSSGGNGDGLRASGHGTGDGIAATGGSTGQGVHAVGGATSGAGIRAEAQAGNSNGANFVGQGSGHGIAVDGGATGHGLHARGGASAGDGIRTEAQAGDGNGLNAIGQGAGLDLAADNLATAAQATAIQATTDKLDDMLVLSSDGWIFTIAALQDAPGGGSAPSAAEIADAVWDEALAGHATVGSAGAALSAAGSAGDPWSTPLPGAYGAGTAGAIVGNNLDAAVSSRAAATDLATVAGYIDTEIADIQSRLPAALVGGRMDASVGAMAANVMTASALATDAVSEIQTGLSTLDAAGVRAAVGLASANLDTQLDALPTAAENAAAVMGSTIEGTFDLTESARLWNAALAGKASGLSGTAATFRDLADTKDRIVATVDADGNRTAVTRDVT